MAFGDFPATLPAFHKSIKPMQRRKPMKGRNLILVGLTVLIAGVLGAVPVWAADEITVDP